MLAILNLSNWSLIVTFVSFVAYCPCFTTCKCFGICGGGLKMGWNGFPEGAKDISEVLPVFYSVGLLVIGE
jgi:hypothetical protein